MIIDNFYLYEFDMVIFGVGNWIKDSCKKEESRLKRDSCRFYNGHFGSCLNYKVICCHNCKRWDKKKEVRKRIRKKKLGDIDSMVNDNIVNDNIVNDNIVGGYIEIETGIDRRQWILQKVKVGEKILDIGSADGWIFKGTPFSQYVTSIDLDKYDFQNFFQMDAHDIKFPDQFFDVAILGEILEHVEDPVKVINEASRVAKRVLMTIPNEYEWDKSLYPFEKIEEGMERRNLTLEEIVKVSNPNVKELYMKDNHKHLFHNRYYTEDLLRKNLISAGIVDYQMKKLRYGQPQWSFFTVDTDNNVKEKNVKEKNVENKVETGNNVHKVDEKKGITFGSEVSIGSIIPAKGKLRIALISTPFFGVPPIKYGGLEQIVWDLAEGLDELGHLVTLFAPEGSKVPKHGSLVVTGPAIDTVGVDWYREEEKRYFVWKNVVTPDRFDVVHDHTWFAFPYFHKMNDLKVKVIHTHHGGLVWETAPPFPKPNLVAISKFMRDYTINYFKQKGFNVDCRFVHNGIDLSRYVFDSDIKKTNRLLYVGRFSSFKGPHVAIEIAKKTNHKLDIIGSASFVDSQDYVKQLEKSVEGDLSIVLYENASHELKIRKMQEAKAIIVPSKMNEPFGLIAIEAMACGTPVICTRDGALPELVVDGVTGFVCDTEEQMIEAIGKIDTIKSYDCRKRAEEFSRLNMAKGYEKLYQKIMRGEDW